MVDGKLTETIIEALERAWIRGGVTLFPSALEARSLTYEITIC